MKIIYTNVLPPKGYSAINLFGLVLVRKKEKITKKLINHEAIHSAQMKELLYVIFYIWYLIEWIIKLFIYGKNAYFHISFEREAYRNDNHLTYLSRRKPYAFFAYIKESKKN